MKMKARVEFQICITINVDVHLTTENQRKQKRLKSSGGHSDGEGLSLSRALPPWRDRVVRGEKQRGVAVARENAATSSPNTGEPAGQQHRWLVQRTNPFSRAKKTLEVFPSPDHAKV